MILYYMHSYMDMKQLRHYTDTEIRTIYYCKNYLQVKRLSDLCTADGIFVLPSVVKDERSIRQSVSRLNDIKQEQPGEQAWVVWRRFLNTICKNKEEKRANKNTTIINDRDKESTNNKFSIGTLVTKYWSGIPYKGTVTGNTGKYYKIRYEDNDEEELNHSEVRKRTAGKEELQAK
jgi:hypothetical protein